MKIKEEFLFVKAKKKIHKIVLAEIVYMEAMDDYIRILLKGEKNLVTRMTMKSLLDELDPEQFIRVHRSFIVPLSSIEAMGTKTILVNGVELPVGKQYAESVAEGFRKCG